MRAKTWKALIVAALAVVILTAAVGGTMAWLSTKTSDLTNTFVPAKVTCAVVEPGWKNGTSTTKSDVTIQNTGDTDAYIRVAVIGNWYQGDKVVASWTDNIVLSSSDWFKANDGYYYYKKSVAGLGYTTNLFDSYTPTTRPDGVPDDAHFEMNIICQAIQSTPTTAVTSAWGVQVDANGNLISGN